MKHQKKTLLAIALVFTVATTVYGMKQYRTSLRTSVATPKIKKYKISQQDQIKIIIKKNIQDIQDCYNQRLDGGLDRGGKLKISWDINEVGLASNFYEERNELNDAELFDCSSLAISQWQFPKGIFFKINYTFKLKQKVRETASNN